MRSPKGSASQLRSTMRVYITSTSDDLTAHRTAALEVTAGLGSEALTPVPDPRGAGRDAVAVSARRIAHADLVLAIVGWRRGAVPGPELGGDGQRSWTEWEVRSAFRQAKPVVVLRADDNWPLEMRESDAQARARIADFRGELDRLAIPFAAEREPLAGFRDRLERELSRYARELWARPRRPEQGPALGLRQWPRPDLPERPYPLLLPYSHPDLLGGRRRELETLLALLAEPVPILGLYAPSGAGKSSLLGGGLIPWLHAVGRPATFERHPDEPGLAGRLVGDLLTLLDPAGGTLRIDDDRYSFVEHLLEAARLAGRPPVLVLDQFEDLLRPDKERARAVVGTLLAASVQHQPGYHAPICRWILSYRQEFHGALCGWLTDVLGEVPGTDLAEVSCLPHDLSGPERFHTWALPALGTPSPGAEDRIGEATRAFRDAISTPLDLRTDDGTLRYPWRFAGDGAARLARAFGEARLARPGSPLVPELQVVLAHLLATSDETGCDGTIEIEVPEEPGELIDRALEEHLRRALDAAFPASPRADARIGRTRALLALRELADVEGRRRQGLPIAALARAIIPGDGTPGGRRSGSSGREVLEKLAKPPLRLVLLEQQDDEQVYVLSHDRMAEVVARLVDDEGAYAELGVEAELLGLRRFVALQRELFAAGEVEQATEIPTRQFEGVERHSDALLWDDEGRQWWTACQKRRRRDRRRKAIRWGITVAAVALLAALVWIWADRFFARRELLRTIVAGEPEAAFAALWRLGTEFDTEAAELLAQMRQRERPFDVLERGLGGVDEDVLGPAVLWAAELVLPVIAEAPADPVRIASTVWALDFFAVTDPALRQQAMVLRDQVLGPLRRTHPPPPRPARDDPDWSEIPAGTFQMGSGSAEGRDDESMADERPRHPVRLKAFRLMVHEVTHAEFRRLYPEVDGEDDVPAVRMTWYEAYTYAAWLGGRLPTEAEWEYAARAGCPYAYCKRDRSEATLDQVAWWLGNSTNPETGEPSRKRVMQLEPNPWGLYDTFGNVGEITANWYGPYSEGLEVDPPGATNSAQKYRSARGGSVWHPAEWVVASGRGVLVIGSRSWFHGFRVAFPESLSNPGSGIKSSGIREAGRGIPGS